MLTKKWGNRADGEGMPRLMDSLGEHLPIPYLHDKEDRQPPPPPGHLVVRPPPLTPEGSEGSPGVLVRALWKSGIKTESDVQEIHRRKGRRSLKDEEGARGKDGGSPHSPS